MTFAATQYTKANASDMMANYAAIRARLMNPPKPRRLAIASLGCLDPSEGKIEADEAAKAKETHIPVRQSIGGRFDLHVLAFEAHKLEQSLGGHRLKRYISDRAKALGVSYFDVISPSHKRECVEPRDQIQWELKMIVKPDISYPELGRLFGNRHHTTAWHSVRKVQAKRAIMRERETTQLETSSFPPEILNLAMKAVAAIPGDGPARKIDVVLAVAKAIEADRQRAKGGEA